jgi:TolB-like protein/tetratricopeptide (TPR) repeat protein
MEVDAKGRITPPFLEPDSTGVSVGEVTAALDLILASQAFANVERPSRFLRHVVETTLRGEQAKLKETLLGIEVFGRDTSWNTRLDPIVRQEAARLRKRLARYYETTSPEVRIDLPVGAYVPIFHRVNGQIADVEIARPDPSIEPAPKAARKNRRYAWTVFAAALLLAGGLVWAWRYFSTRSAGVSPSIVVLPFTNLSADPANEYLATAFTSETTEELERLNSMRVIARSSARIFRSGGADVREVGRRLNVSYVLEGSVERSGDEIRISARLERVSDGLRVWYQTYDRPAKDLSTVQLELAGAVAHSLRVNSGRGSAPRHLPNGEAHELFMRGSVETDQRTPESIARGEQDLRRAVQIDPEYALAWNGLGVAKYNLSIALGRNRTPEELAEATALYHKALDLDPGLSTTRANLATIALTYDWDWSTAERELQLAARGGRDAGAEIQYGLLLSYRGRFREADQHVELARALDPLDSSVSINTVSVRYWESRFPEAIAISRQMLERNPDRLGPQFMLNISYIQAGQPEVALANLRPIETRFLPMRLFEVMALGRLGRHEEGVRLIHQLETEYEGDPQVYRQWFAAAWASLGDHVQTLKWLERSADLRESQVLNLAVNPAFAAMRNDPGFRALVRRIGL